MLNASLHTFDVMKGRLVTQRRRWQQYKDKAEENGSNKRQNATFKGRFSEKTNGANLGYKNPLKQGVILFFFLGGTICVALMEIN